MDDDGLTLDQAAIFAEFEGDDQATEKLTRALLWNRPLAHVAQQLRDAATEAAALTAEAERLRAEGLPALDPTDLPADWRSLRLDRLVSRDGEPIPEREWPSIPGAALVVAPEWRYPDHQTAEDSETEDLTAGDDDPIAVFVPMWRVALG